MICPHCSTFVKIEFKYTEVLEFENLDNGVQYGTQIFYGECPNCTQISIGLKTGIVKFIYGARMIVDEDASVEKIVYPYKKFALNTAEIPEKYLGDYNEACKILTLSPKSSAALSRRIIQHILRDEFQIKKKNLSEEIEEFISNPGIPSYLINALDVGRILGNIAAHPTKDLNTGEIVCVEEGEAEWLIEIIEFLFDFTFIQPKKLIKRKEELNEKLKLIGKPSLK